MCGPCGLLQEMPWTGRMTGDHTSFKGYLQLLCLEEFCHVSATLKHIPATCQPLKPFYLAMVLHSLWMHQRSPDELVASLQHA